MNIKQFYHQKINKLRKKLLKQLGDACGIIGKSQGVGFDGGQFLKK